MKRFAILLFVLQLSCPVNSPPDIPSTPSGPSTTLVEDTCLFSSSATDPDNDKVAIRFDWGDGSLSGWSGYVSSGSSVSLSHLYSKEGTYYVKAVSRDIRGAESDWSDSCKIVVKENHPPYPASNPSPSNGAVDQPLSLTLSWKGGDPDGDKVHYNLYFGTSTTPPLKASLNSPSYSISNLLNNTTYYWRIVSEDEYNSKTDGPLWYFKTTAPPNHPPNIPSAPSGPSTGNLGETYTFSSSATDPDNDKVAIRFDWGDGDLSSWSAFVSSGYFIQTIHSYSQEGYFTIRAQAKDIKGSLSQWSSGHTIHIESPNNPPDKPLPPSGPSSGVVDTLYTFSTKTTDPDGDMVAYRFNWGDGNISPWSSYKVSGTEISMSHSYKDSGYYSIRAQAKDIHGLDSKWSEGHRILITLGNNHPPNIPSTPSGPSEAKIGEAISFSTSTTDPDNDDVAYKFDWGDGSSQGWTPYYRSGEEITKSHSFFIEGTYIVRVKAKDSHKTESEWSEGHTIVIKKSGPPPSYLVLYEPIVIAPDSITLMWSWASKEDFERYEVHRSLHQDFTPDSLTKVAEITEENDTLFTVKELPRAPWYFKVVVFTRSGGMGVSNEVSATPIVVYSYALSPGRPLSIDISQDYAYVAAKERGILCLSIATDPPLSVWDYLVSGHYAFDVDVVEGFVYGAFGSAGLHILQSPGQCIGKCDTIDAISVYGTSNYAYVGGSDNYLRVVDISAPGFYKPVIGSILLPDRPNDIYVSGYYAFVACADAGLQIVDIANPTDLKLSSQLSITGSANRIYVSNGCAYIAALYGGLIIADVGDPASPREVAKVRTFPFLGLSIDAYDVYVYTGYAYVAIGKNGLMKVDVSNPENPHPINLYVWPEVDAKCVRTTSTHAYVGDYSRMFRSIKW